MIAIPASLKAARAVNGDDWFVERLKAFCVTEEIPFSQRLALMVAMSVTDLITVDEFMTVSTLNVTDTDLQAALNTQWKKLSEETVPDEAE